MTSAMTIPSVAEIKVAQQILFPNLSAKGNIWAFKRKIVTIAIFSIIVQIKDTAEEGKVMRPVNVLLSIKRVKLS